MRSSPLQMLSNDLKTAVSSTLRRQHFLNASPGAQRLLPLAALAVGDYVARKSQAGENVVENLLCNHDGAKDAVVTLAAPAATLSTGSTSNGVPELDKQTPIQPEATDVNDTTASTPSSMSAHSNFPAWTTKTSTFSQTKS